MLFFKYLYVLVLVYVLVEMSARAKGDL